ncbi:EamA family transporter [Enterovibrio nigricans]|uniref:EamA-like transporter family protein n=2 Tax=Enterovibrio nigricans TaxID=504469 RepID=A0A1T4UKH0_9GAMM|nr:DMT family transporter [Enterovibrio nigricans]PKF51211.1 EamA family transporter [Enterovibrio nigricans]SKA53189.1 EamA-like transporter family protein [Enterovibrio nigricans DSM 22720]
MSVALASFCLMAVAAKELSSEVDTFQVLFFRSFIGLIVITSILLASRKTGLFYTQKLKLHGVRNSVHFLGQMAWFIGIGLLPLAEIFALKFTVPLWTALIAALCLKEKLTFKKLLAIAFGFSGVLIIVQPGMKAVDVASLIVLAAAICYAVAHTCTKSLSSTEHPLTILFYMSLIQLPIGFTLAMFNWQTPEGIQWFWLAAIALTSLIAHFSIVKAMQNAEATVVVTMDFLRLPLIAIVGVLFYTEPFEVALLAGAALMLCGNLINVASPKGNISRVAEKQ